MSIEPKMISHSIFEPIYVYAKRVDLDNGEWTCTSSCPRQRTNEAWIQEEWIFEGHSGIQKRAQRMCYVFSMPRGVIFCECIRHKLYHCMALADSRTSQHPTQEIVGLLGLVVRDVGREPGNSYVALCRNALCPCSVMCLCLSMLVKVYWNDFRVRV